MEQEIWKDIPGYNGKYKISNTGNILSEYSGKIRKHSISQGYYMMRLSKNNIKKTISIHRLVAMTFIPTNDINMQVNHKNGIKTDNSVDNLEWVTASDNIKHSYKYLGRTSPNIPKKVIQIYKGCIIKSWDSIALASRSLNIPHSNITNTCTGVLRSAGGFNWEYI